MVDKQCSPDIALLPCPFCGSADIDPAFVMYANDSECSPGCHDCGATAETAEKWNSRPGEVTGARDKIEEAACLIWAELCPGMVMGDDDLPHYEAAAKAVLALRDLAQRPVWQPIETAPKDGTEIIGVFHRRYDEDSPATVYGPWTLAWDGRKWRSSWDGSEVISSESDFGTEYKGPDIDPTHWMPLPGVSIPSTTRETLFGGTNFCGHGVMAATCTICHMWSQVSSPQRESSK